MAKRMKTSKYAVTYIPNKRNLPHFAVNRLKRGQFVKKKYIKNTSIIRASSPSQALRKLSASSYYQETGKRLKRRK